VKEEINGTLLKLNDTAYFVRKYIFDVQNSNKTSYSSYYNVRRVNFVRSN